MTNALIPYDSINRQPAAVMEFVNTMGDAFYRGGMYGVKSAGQGKMVALTCLTEGMTPTQFQTKYHILADGKLQLQSVYMHAKMLERGWEIEWLEDGDDGKQASAKFTRGDREKVIKFTIDDAKRQGLVKEKSNYEKNPGAMLRARVVTKAAIMLEPGIVVGNYEDEPAADEPRRQSKKAVKPEPAGEVIDAEYEVTVEEPAPAPAEAPAPEQPDPEQVKIDELKTKANEQLSQLTDKGKELAAKSDEDYTPATRELLEELKQIVVEHDAAAEFKERLADYKAARARDLKVSEAKKVLLMMIGHVLNCHDQINDDLRSEGAESVDKLSKESLDKLLNHYRDQLGN